LRSVARYNHFAHYCPSASAMETRRRREDCCPNSTLRSVTRHCAQERPHKHVHIAARVGKVDRVLSSAVIRRMCAGQIHHLRQSTIRIIRQKVLNYAEHTLILISRLTTTGFRGPSEPSPLSSPPFFDRSRFA